MLFRRVRKAAKLATSFVMSVRPSVRPRGTTRLLLHGFSWNFIFEDFFSEICRENVGFVNLVTPTGYVMHQQV
jgi:hypothetical protein